jgi:hypothetical protein
MARPPRPDGQDNPRPEELDAAFERRGITSEWETLFKEVPPKEARELLKRQLARHAEIQKVQRDLLSKLAAWLTAGASFGAAIGFIEYFKRWLAGK